ncbi:MAG TPA: hypothetical protein VI685_12690 [Candidatus Angelobacter sp.]
MNKVIWRDAVRADLPRILELWDEQEERFAESSVRVDRPQLFWEEGETGTPGWRYRPPIMRLRVAEKNGQIVGFRYVEAIPEVCLMTGDEDVMKTLAKELTEECHLFKSLGFRSGWGLVPERFAKALARFTRYSPVRLWKNLRLIGCDFRDLGD